MSDLIRPALARCAEGLWAAQDDLQPLRAVQLERRVQIAIAIAIAIAATVIFCL